MAVLGYALASLAGGYALAGVLQARGPHEWVCPRAVFTTQQDRIALTFDDGPHENHTPAVLDALAATGAQATFFVVGRNARRFPELLRRIARAGHAVGNHTYSHRSLLGATNALIAREIDDAQHAIEDALGLSPILLRPPYGHRDFRFHRAAKLRGLVPVMWSVNVRDYAQRSAEQVARRLERARSGDIVLLHDGESSSSVTAAGVALHLGSPQRRVAIAPLVVPARCA